MINKKNAHYSVIEKEMEALRMDVINGVKTHGESINSEFWFLPVNDKDFDTIYALPLDVNEFREHLVVALGVIEFSDEYTLVAYYNTDNEAKPDEAFYALTKADILETDGKSSPNWGFDYLEVDKWGNGYWQQTLINIAECLEWQEYI